jgi:hypothetical protein
MFMRPSADARLWGHATMLGAMPAPYRRSTELSGGAVKFGALAQGQENSYLLTTYDAPNDAPFGASPVPAAAGRRTQPYPGAHAASVCRPDPPAGENRTAPDDAAAGGYTMRVADRSRKAPYEQRR